MGYLTGTVAALVMLAASVTAPQIKSTTKLTIIVDARGLVEITAPEVLALSHRDVETLPIAATSPPSSAMARTAAGTAPPPIGQL